MIRAAIYEAIGAADRSRLHKQIGEVLEDLYRADPIPHLGELAYHFRLGAQQGNIQKAIDYSRKAANAAVYNFAYEQSIAYLEAALNLTGSKDSSAVAMVRETELAGPGLVLFLRISVLQKSVARFQSGVV